MKELLKELSSCGLVPFLNNEKLLLKFNGLEEVYDIELNKDLDFIGYSKMRNFQVSSLYGNDEIKGFRWLLAIAGFGKVVNFNGYIENVLTFDESLKNKALEVIKKFDF